LSQSPQARLVDIHDGDKVVTRGTRMHQLVDVKRPLAKSFDGSRIPNPQGEKSNKKQEANDPSDPEAAHPFQENGHSRRSAGA
jgi:hypothetical protein